MGRFFSDRVETALKYIYYDLAAGIITGGHAHGTFFQRQGGDGPEIHLL